MRRIIISVLIILLFAAGLLVYKSVAAREWIVVNLFTVATRAKQAKYLSLAERHLDEPEVYTKYLRQAEQMAEVLLYLDGAEVPVAERFEEATRQDEQKLAAKRPILYEALDAARIENENMFRFLVKDYQFNQADIEKHKLVVGEHIALVEELMGGRGITGEQRERIRELLVEAKKYQAAGLNVKAYELVSKAKGIVYSKISN